jgi:beta-mannosidase
VSRVVQVLNGAGWTMREALGETWRWYIDAPLTGWGNNVGDAARAGQRAPGWWPAEVPGSVVTDLWRAGELPDPYRGRATRAAEWTGDRAWVYRRTVDLRRLAPGEQAVLEFDGIDPSGSVFWDGELLGCVFGLYRRARFAVPDRLATAGEHRLAVVLDPIPPSQPQVGRTELVRVHRPRMNEGWDFCPRFPHQGIWRPARLVVSDAHVHDVGVRTTLDRLGHGRVELAATVTATGGPDVRFEFRLVDAGGRPVAAQRGSTSGSELVAELDVAAPELWWPRGYGRPVTYTAQLFVADEPDPVWQGTVGFRRAELVPNPGAPADARPYTAVVNGTAMPLLGWNWAPVDAQYGAVRPARVQHLVELAARSGARLLRVWGGGLVESEEFYDACDRAGLLIWQEFSQSSSGMQSAPSTDDAFVRLMIDEAAAVIPARTHHPSLFLWGGGNELDLDGTPLTEQHSPVLAAVRDTVARLDPGRAWTPTSPTGPVFHNRLDVIAAAPDRQHDVHGPWEHQGLRGQHTLYDAGCSLSHTEFGVEGMTNRRALERLVPEPDRWPADRTNPVYRHLGDWWNNAPLVQHSFGDRLTDLEALQRASQLLQATGLGYAVEADRRRYPHCSTVLPWQLAESYPNAWCTSSVDHAGNPKPAYYAVTRAFAPSRVTLRTPTSVWADEPELVAEAWLWAEAGEAAGTRVTARLLSAFGEVLAERGWTVDAAISHPYRAGTLGVPAADVPADAVVIWELSWQRPDGSLVDREAVLACTGADFAPLLDLAPAALEVSVAAGAVEVTHRGGPAVIGLQVVDDRPDGAPGWICCDGDPRPLLPGEARRFGVRGDHTDGPFQVRVESWNTDPVRIELTDSGRTTA